MSGSRGVDPIVSIVADDRHLRMSVGLRGGLEVMGLPATVFDTALKLLAENPAFDHVIVVGDPEAALFASSNGAPTAAPSSDRKDARLFSSHTYPQTRTDYPAYWRAAGQILAQSIEANISKIEIAAHDDGTYRLTDPLNPSESSPLASFDAADTAQAYIKSFLEMCGPLIHEEQSQPGQGVFLFNLHERRYEALVETQRDGEIFTRVRVELRPLGFWSHPAPKEALPLEHDWSHSDAAEEASDSAPIIRMVNTIHAQALREGAHRIVLQSHERGVKLDYAIGDYDFEIMTLPLHIRDAFVQRLRIMADLWLANRRVVQHGKYSVRFEGIDYEFHVTFTPGNFGDRVEMTRHDLQDEVMKRSLAADESQSRLPLDGKLVLLLGNESVDTSLREHWAALGCRRLIATTVPIDTASALLFTLTFYRALMRHGDERAAFKKAKTAVFSGEEIKLFE